MLAAQKMQMGYAQKQPAGKWDFQPVVETLDQAIQACRQHNAAVFAQHAVFAGEFAP